MSAAVPLAERYAAYCAACPLQHAAVAEYCWPYRIGGPTNAPAVLLLPGALGRPETGFEYAEALQTTFRVVAPGYPKTAKTMADLANGAAQLLRGLGVARAHVVGGSFGGLVAQATVDRFPQSVNKMVLSDTSPPVPTRALWMRAAGQIIRALPARMVRAALGLGVRRYVAHLPPDARRFWLAHFDEMLAQLTKAEVESRARAWAEFDAAPAPHNATPCPKTLILCAESDRTVSPHAFRARFPRAKVHVIASPLGHAASIGDAPAYLAPILRFLTEAKA